LGRDIYFKQEAFFDRRYQDLNPINFGYQRCDGGHTGRGMRNYYMIHYVENGTGTLTVRGKTYTVTKGELFVVLKGEDAVYVADSENPWSYVWIGFSGKFAKRLEKLEEPVMAADSTPFGMIKSLHLRADTREEVGASALHLIFADIFAGKSSHPHYVKRTANTIESLYMHNISVSEIADSLGLDRRYLSRIFHKSMGMSIQEYIIKVRMDAAKKLLSDGRSVSLTAELVGYNDVFNFSKMFKKHCGVSPKNYAVSATVI
jgi:AraC-like DNA-binding protein